MTLLVGQQRPLRMRRIGRDHIVVLPAQEATVVDLRQAKRNLALLMADIKRKREELASVERRAADLADTIRAAVELPVERVEDDPDVDPKPPAAPAKAPAPPQEESAAAE